MRRAYCPTIVSSAANSLISFVGPLMSAPDLDVLLRLEPGPDVCNPRQDKVTHSPGVCGIDAQPDP